MDQRLGLLNTRIDCCKRLRLQACTKDEKDGWLAEEEGLHDALLGRERTDLIRVCYPSQVERYWLGFHDGLSLLNLPSRRTMRRYLLRRAGPSPSQTIDLGGPRSPQSDSANYKEKSR